MYFLRMKLMADGKGEDTSRIHFLEERDALNMAYINSLKNERNELADRVLLLEKMLESITGSETVKGGEAGEPAAPREEPVGAGASAEAAQREEPAGTEAGAEAAPREEPAGAGAAAIVPGRDPGPVAVLPEGEEHPFGHVDPYDGGLYSEWGLPLRGEARRRVPADASVIVELFRRPGADIPPSHLEGERPVQEFRDLIGATAVEDGDQMVWLIRTTDSIDDIMAALRDLPNKCFCECTSRVDALEKCDWLQRVRDRDAGNTGVHHVFAIWCQK